MEKGSFGGKREGGIVRISESGGGGLHGESFRDEKHEKQ